nr:MAG TPA: hypothetical protein [Caudoviricetes sp.]
MILYNTYFLFSTFFCKNSHIIVSERPPYLST